MTENIINILYISIEGNTRNFIKLLTNYANQQHELNNDNPIINAKEITEQSDFQHETENFFVFVPTYLDGGNGIDNGVKELMTNVLGEYIDFGNNAQHCIGVVGSGNKNFNEQYCLTARRYAEKFDAPFLADYELRGNDSDAKRIYEILKNNN
ncbi:MAG: class Ib ribonucleoside-diphosphate reductase assembly flavoprotein NrdI [Firmicutes bacterium]|uniref:Class Ib ribonucleoside-diphosphate reductase assembly flavoprotein NrdI n=1 Tax=Candidatus Gallilactobacillus intestinavium TaxID=2840838 RepID=A0A9D9E9J7_9LACO|nr:class Ib ribonucleoside-diphosphate reductase assembly flavoprotein NrdI [Candidatus Gallilactobacillus intestinavium]